MFAPAVCHLESFGPSPHPLLFALLLVCHPMSSSDISFVDDLVARRIDEDYGKMRYVACYRLPLPILS